MKTKLLLVILCGISMLSNAQITWSRYLTAYSTNTIEEAPDGSFIACLDSGGSYLLKLDAYGNTIWVKHPTPRLPDDILFCAYPDNNGHYILGGQSPDTTFTYDTEPYIQQVDENGNNINFNFFTPGDLGGYVSGVMRMADSTYVAGMFMDDNGGSNHSEIHHTGTNLTTLPPWPASATGGAIRQGAMAIDMNQNIIFGTYNVTGATIPSFRKYNEAGTLLYSITAPDTFTGGSLCMEYPTLTVIDDQKYVIGASLLPLSGTYTYPEIVKLDTDFTIMWQKTFDWGEDAVVRGIAPASNNGMMVMMNYQSKIFLVRLNANGDSLWSTSYAGNGNASGRMMRRCMDLGYVIGASDDLGAWIFKTDSSARILPPVYISNSGGTMICANDSVTLSAVPGYAYNWSNGATTSSVTVGPGTYSVTVSAIGSADSAVSSPLTISAYPSTTPVINASPNLLTCTTPAASYQWYFNSSVIGGATDSVYTPFQTGNYSVSIIDTNGCPGVSAQVYFSPVGISENQKEIFNAWQQDDFLKINFKNSDGGMVKLLNNQGQIIFTEDVSAGEKEKTISLNKLANGIYFVHYYQKSERQIKKTIISK
jgi:hypothetical protein